MDDLLVETVPVEVRVENGVGRITLNRPKALNALTTAMCALMAETLRKWAADDAVKIVMIDHEEGTRGFCAGGDIRKVAQSGRGDGREAEAFFATEYKLNAMIKRFPKPYLAVMDGITMGGGVGICGAWLASCRHRTHGFRHAGDRHRPVPRRRRGLVPAAARRRARHLAGADGRKAQGRRRPGRRDRYPFRSRRLDDEVRPCLARRLCASMPAPD